MVRGDSLVNLRRGLVDIAAGRHKSGCEDSERVSDGLFHVGQINACDSRGCRCHKGDCDVKHKAGGGLFLSHVLNVLVSGDSRE